jgi:hypothetical protein
MIGFSPLASRRTGYDSEPFRGRRRSRATMKTMRRVTSDEINNRLAKVSDAQLHELAMQINALVPGGDIDGLLGTILTIALIVLLLVVILILI